MFKIKDFGPLQPGDIVICKEQVTRGSQGGEDGVMNTLVLDSKEVINTKTYIGIVVQADPSEGASCHYLVAIRDYNGIKYCFHRKDLKKISEEEWRREYGYYGRLLDEVTDTDGKYVGDKDV